MRKRKKGINSDGWKIRQKENEDRKIKILMVTRERKRVDEEKREKKEEERKVGGKGRNRFGDMKTKMK